MSVSHQKQTPLKQTRLLPGVQVVLRGGEISLEFESEAHRRAWSVLEELCGLLGCRHPEAQNPPSISHRTLPTNPPELRFASLAPRLGWGWFTLLAVLYDVHRQEPHPVIPVEELHRRSRIAATKIRAMIGEYRDGYQDPSPVTELVRCFIEDIRPENAACGRSPSTNSPYQFFMRPLDEALALSGDRVTLDP